MSDDCKPSAKTEASNARTRKMLASKKPGFGRPPDLGRCVSTLEEHRARLAASGRIPLSPEEERAIFPEAF